MRVRVGWPKEPDGGHEDWRGVVTFQHAVTRGLLWFRWTSVPWPDVMYVKVFPTGWGVRVGRYVLTYNYCQPESVRE